MTNVSLVITRAQAADLPVSADQLNLAKQVLDNAVPLLQPQDQTDPEQITTTPPEGFLAKPLVAETTLRPEDPKPKARPKIVSYKTTSRVVSPIIDSNLGNHFFPYGYCTWYVASKRNIPWSGNAGTWLAGARAFGFATGSAPKAGAIMVTYEGGRAGHVAYVNSVNGNEFTVTEMNFHGFGVISSRIVSTASSFIKGFIY